MQGNAFIELLRESPLIAAVKSGEGLAGCLASDCAVVFVLYGDLLGIGETVARIKSAGKLALVHIDLIGGLSAREEVAADFIAQYARADGIISTKPGMVRRAKELGLLAVQRFFLLDSLALVNIARQRQPEADAIEILPGVMPKVIRRLVGLAEKPVIAGGLIADKQDVLGALGAGAVAVSSSNRDVWRL